MPKFDVIICLRGVEGDTEGEVTRNLEDYLEEGGKPLLAHFPRIEVEATAPAEDCGAQYMSKTCCLRKGHKGRHRSLSLVEWDPMCRAREGASICRLQEGHKGPHRSPSEMLEWMMPASPRVEAFRKIRADMKKTIAAHSGNMQYLEAIAEAMRRALNVLCEDEP